MTGVTVGIDLGTSNSCVALYTQEAEVIPNEFGDRTTPSVIAFAEDGKLLVGSPAQRQAIMNPRRTITAVKRLLARRLESDVVKSLARVIPYELTAAANGDVWVKVGDTPISPQEVQAYVLESLRASAARFLGAPVTRAVITVPAFFDEVQRQAVRDSARIAGFDHCRVLAEPTAAALAYGYAQLDNRTIVIVDLGGGTLDVTVMNVNGGRFEVLATDGDLLLGGHDFDNAIALALASEIKAEHATDVLGDPVAVQRLVAEAESAKRRLSTEQKVTIELPYLATGPGGPVNYSRVLTRDQLVAMTRQELDRIAQPCREALRLAGVIASRCDDVILVGGMTRSPAIQAKVAELFQRRPSLRVNPDEVVAIGAALLASGESGRALSFVDVLPRGIGIRAAGDKMVPLIAKSTPMPAKGTKTFATTTDNQRVFELRLVQGEDPVASRNRELASVVIDGIPPLPAGQIKLKVAVTVDADGGLAVDATELTTGAVTRAHIEPSAGLARSQLERLVAEHRSKRGEAGAASAAAAPAPSQRAGGFSVDFSSAPAPAANTPRAAATAPVKRPAVEPRKAEPAVAEPAKPEPAKPAAPARTPATASASRPIAARTPATASASRPIAARTPATASASRPIAARAPATASASRPIAARAPTPVPVPATPPRQPAPRAKPARPAAIPTSRRLLLLIACAAALALAAIAWLALS